MRLRKFKKKVNRNQKKIIIALIVILATLTSILVDRTYAFFQKEAEVRFINAKVADFKVYLTNVTATSTTTTIDLSYTESGTVSTRTCKYGTTSGSYTTNASSQTSTKCSLTGLNAETTYYYQVCVSNNGGEECKEGDLKTKPNISLINTVKVGDYIRMTPTSTSYKLSDSLYGCTGKSSTCSQNTFNPSELNLWRVIKINDDGTVDMVSDRVSSVTMNFYGALGYRQLVGALDSFTSKYTDEVHVERTRHMGYSNQTYYCKSTSSSQIGCSNGDEGYVSDLELVNAAYKGNSTCVKSCTGLKARIAGKTSYGAYWIASRGRNSYANVSKVGGRYIDAEGTLAVADLYCTNCASGGDAGGKLYIRPIVTLKSSTEYYAKSGGGWSKADPYELV